MYIVDQVGLEGKDIFDLHKKLQSYLNDKHNHSHPWEVVNIVSIEKLYTNNYNLDTDRITGLDLTGINVTILWRTHR